VIQPINLTLSEEERRQLTEIVKRHPKPYVREHAAAILKIADGWFATQVAREGLLQVRHPSTVCTWVKLYRLEGSKSFEVKDGRGRKPAFSPSVHRTRTG
jgi:transposase